jgi:hypothetical protein
MKSVLIIDQDLTWVIRFCTRLHLRSDQEKTMGKSWQFFTDSIILCFLSIENLFFLKMWDQMLLDLLIP